MSECVQMHQRTCENAEKTEEKLRTFKKLFCPDQETLAPHDYIAGFLFPRTGLTCFFLGAERDGKGVYRRYGEILRPHWHVQTHHRSSKVSLRQKKSRSDFFWRRPCGRSAQSSSSCGRAGRHSKRRAGWQSKRREGGHSKRRGG